MSLISSTSSGSCLLRPGRLTGARKCVRWSNLMQVQVPMHVPHALRYRPRHRSRQLLLQTHSQRTIYAWWVLYYRLRYHIHQQACFHEATVQDHTSIPPHTDCIYNIFKLSVIIVRQSEWIICVRSAVPDSIRGIRDADGRNDDGVPSPQAETEPHDLDGLG